MADQVAISIPQTIVDERSGFTATARFRDRATAAASTPTTVHYKLFNISTKEVIRDFTSVTPGSEVSIAIDGQDLKITNDTQPQQRIALTVVADKDLSTQVSQERQFRIRNIHGIEFNG